MPSASPREPLHVEVYPQARWALATDVDHFPTLVAGRSRLIDRILRDAALEAFEVNPPDELGFDADTINPDRRTG